jgi:hypothetical protein
MLWSLWELHHFICTYLWKNVLQLYISKKRELVHITSYVQGVELVEVGDSDPCTAVYHSHVCHELHLLII